MNTNLDAVIKNVASKNGVGLHKDDPLMALVTIINQLTEDQQAGVVAALEKYREVHEGLAAQWRHDAKDTANIVLNAALDAGCAAMSKGMSDGAAQVVAIVSNAAKNAVDEQRRVGKELLRDMQIFAIGMTTVATVILAIATCLAFFRAIAT